MLLYTLGGPDWMKDIPIDSFSSLIWTERYNAAGDVTLTMPEDSDLAGSISEGTYLHLPVSREVMLIDTVSTENGIIKYTGQSLAGFLAQRMLRDTWQTTKDSWSQTGTPSAIARAIVTQMCVTGGIMAGTAVLASPNGAREVIPNLTVAADPGGGTSTQVAIPYGNVYDAVKAVCDLDGLGFTMYPPSFMDGTGNLSFLVYRGLDRTTAQSTNPVVIFEPSLDSFTDVKKLRSIANYKTVAWAWANGMTAQSSLGVAYAPGFSSSVTGFDRRTLMVDASDVNAADYTAANLITILNQKAADALANNNYVKMLDGQIVPQLPYQYGAQYNLGDIIELRGIDSTAQYARVTEYVRTQDNTGETAYPTLSVIS